jgi:cell division protein FtsN
VQVGSFTQKNHAQKELTKVKKKADKSSKIEISQAIVNEQTYYRVLIGPFVNKKKAEIMVKKLAKKGQKSIIIRNK